MGGGGADDARRIGVRVSVARRWVFPIIWMVIFAAIAAALVKVAFFPSGAEAQSDGIVPTGEIVEPHVEVALGTIRNDVVLDATVSADAAIPVKATLAGEVRKVMGAVGRQVDADTALFTIRAETVNAEGAVSTRTVTVRAGASGVVSSFAVLPGQMVSVGETVGQVAPPSFHVSATLGPEQLYRLVDAPTEATVAINGGPAPFTCSGVTITTPLAGAGSEGEQASGIAVRCAVPAEVRVFAGLKAVVTLAGGIAEDVIVLPITAVEGAAGNGIVHVVGADGEIVETPVTLGLNDGKHVEITGGISAGDSVLEFVPGAPGKPGSDPFEGAIYDEFGNVVGYGG